MALDLAQLCCTWEAGGQLDSLELHFPLVSYQQQPAWWRQQRSGNMMPALASGGLLSQVVAAVASAAPEETPEQAQTPAPSLAPLAALAEAETPAAAGAPHRCKTGVAPVPCMAHARTSSWREVPPGSGRFCLLLARQMENEHRLQLSGK